MTPFSVVTLPLHGSRLIEASAGTGKTWTIAAVVLRLVLGHECTPRHPREILVMSFTRAATRELASRIRARLHHALAVFEGHQSADGDPLMEALLPQFAGPSERGMAVQRLRIALDTIDEAAVHTIDAWCQRMLREHAFDSGSRFDETLSPDDADAVRTAQRDYWRREVLSLPAESLRVFCSIWPDIDTLQADLASLGASPLPSTEWPEPLGPLWHAWATERLADWDTLRGQVVQAIGAAAGWCNTARSDKGHPLVKLIPQANKLNEWLETLTAWAQSSEVPNDVPITDAAQKRFEQLAEAVPTETSAFAVLAGLRTSHRSLPSLRLQLLKHALAWTEASVQSAKREAAVFGFSDLLHRLHHALNAPEAGPALAARIRAQYPVALIDEFQDTSPTQLQIFDRVFSIGEPQPDTTLLLIGDPKQAIYRFRGADIHSYLVARRLTAGRHHMLDTNFRSTPELVHAVNQLFVQAEQHCAQGAFRFGPAASTPVPFHPVHSRPANLELLRTPDGPAVPPITARVDPLPRPKDEALRHMARDAATAIAAWLGPDGATLRSVAAQDDAARPLQPGDIAVLVRSADEAQVMHMALARCGIDAVYLSGNTSVWSTIDAEEVYHLLQAMAHPRDSQRARRAFATALFNASSAELCALADDEQRFDQRCQHWAPLLEVWQTYGVLAALRRAIVVFDLQFSAARERSLTNLLHLGELLQAASTDHPTPATLLQWMEGALRPEATPPDEALMRLESDAQRVQLVTIHKSKGLEYPVVFLPFAASTRAPIKPSKGGPKASPRSGRPALTLPDPENPGTPPQRVWNPSASHYALENLETDRENLRLLYVALTRARHAVWMGISAVKSLGAKLTWHDSALGYLLSGPSRDTAAASEPGHESSDAADAGSPVVAAVERWARSVPGLVMEPSAPATEPLILSASRRVPARPVQPARTVSRAIDSTWTLTSYSALVRDLRRGALAAGVEWTPGGVDRPGLDDEPRLESLTLRTVQAGAESAAVTAPSTPAAALPPWHRFPRGAAAGTLLHDLLEWLAGEGFALQPGGPIAMALLHRCERAGWGTHGSDALTWLSAVVAQPLPPWNVPLAALRTALPEMEFWLPVASFSTPALDAVCQRHALPQAERPTLLDRTVRGFLMGFADLVVEHDGRYWVLDYKSNAVDTAVSQDSPTAVAPADPLAGIVLDHRYDVQAGLYLWALHCLLRSRLGTHYRPEQHLGGAVFLFLRAWDGPTHGCCVLPATPDWMNDMARVLPAPPAPDAHDTNA